MKYYVIILLALNAVTCIGCQYPDAGKVVPVPSAKARLELDRAKLEATRCVAYDASYRKLAYPGGDVPENVGACTDVVIRSLRAAGTDLQRAIHEDMKARPGRYPKYADGNRTDPNIDHRRVPNQIAYFKHTAQELPTDTSHKSRASWQPGDLVFWKLSISNKDHVGIISDKIGRSGMPMVIHNLAHAVEEDCLTSWRIQAHFRPFPTRDAAKQ